MFLAINSGPVCPHLNWISFFRNDKAKAGLAKIHLQGTTRTNENFIHEEIKCRLNLGNACYAPLQNPASSLLLPETEKLK
jgi:hypothetical protein